MKIPFQIYNIVNESTALASSEIGSYTNVLKTSINRTQAPQNSGGL